MTRAERRTRRNRATMKVSGMRIRQLSGIFKKPKPTRCD